MKIYTYLGLVSRNLSLRNFSLIFPLSHNFFFNKTISSAKYLLSNVDK